MQSDLEDFTLRIIPENTNNTHNTYFGRLLFNSIFHSRDINFPIRHFILRHLVDIEEDEQYEEETSNNPNFMQEKNMNFRLYPFYINWKKIENNESGYYRIYLKYGYLGSAVFASFKDKYPSLDVKNFLYILAEFIQENLVIKNNESKNDENEKNIKDFFDKLPNINELFELIEKKIIMMKEVPLLILLLKIFEIKFILSKNNDDIINILKYEYLLMSYLTDEEYNNIFANHFKGKISKIFKKLTTYNSKYLLPKTKVGFINHIKSIYKSCKINN